MAITVPMTFISGAYFPFTVMPDALKYVGWCNPMTYAVMLFRAVALEKTGLSHEALVQEDLAIKMGNFVVTPFISFLILVIFGFLFLALSTMVFSKMDFSKINRNKADMMTDY
jgi:ABC-2 type transport system permease protein